MKKIFLVAVLFTIVSYSQTFARAAASVSPLLANYYDVKNALVNADQKTAALKAIELSAAITSIDLKSVSEPQLQTVKALQAKLAADAKAIAGAKELSAQRTSFASLSANFYELSKTVKLSDEPVYYDYCPMKKSYWLSNEEAIKNPYYGSQMLTCGSVKETLK